MTLRQLMQAGSDLGRPHGAEFYLYFPTEAAARVVAARYAAQGFSGSVHPDPHGSEWTCVLRKSMILSADALRRLRREFSAVATAYGGDYDGWGTEVQL